MSIFLIWAYHYTSDVQSGVFAQHSFRGIKQVTLIPAVTLTPTTNPVTTPTPGGFNVFDNLQLIRQKDDFLAHRLPFCENRSRFSAASLYYFICQD